MKTFIFKILPIVIFSLSFIVLFYACDKEEILQGPIDPHISTIAVENITEVGASARNYADLDYLLEVIVEPQQLITVR